MKGTVEFIPSGLPGGSGQVMSPAASGRVVSIDIVRALTMVLMIFVNDLWTLHDTPKWLEHVEFGVDGMGLADVVFPAFLFIVGLSLPFAVNNRRRKGESEGKLLLHVITRSLALIVMGVFLVNGEYLNAEATGIPGYLWYPLCCIAFILIWNSYSHTTSKYLVWISRIAGIVVLLILAIIYRGGWGENPGYFSPKWWGILGLIGWAYLAAGLITVLSRNNFFIILGGWVFFCLLSVAFKAGFIPRQSLVSFIPEAILGGTITGFTAGGVLTAFIFRYYVNRGNIKRMTAVLLAFAAFLAGLSVIVRPYWGLSKLGATPAWLFLCSAYTIVAFLVIYLVADVGGRTKWFNIIRPAGTATLLCYLIPYFIYAVRSALPFLELPVALRTDGIGLVKSLLFALLCTAITGVLIRLGIRLKL